MRAAARASAWAVGGVISVALANPGAEQSVRVSIMLWWSVSRVRVCKLSLKDDVPETITLEKLTATKVLVNVSDEIALLTGEPAESF